MFSYFPKVTQEVGNTSGIPTYISVTPETILLISEGMRMKEVEAEPDLPYEKKKKAVGRLPQCLKNSHVHSLRESAHRDILPRSHRG